MTQQTPWDLRRSADEAAREGTQRLLTRLWKELRRIHSVIDRDHPVTIVEVGEGADRPWIASRLPFPAQWHSVEASVAALDRELDGLDGPVVVTGCALLHRLPAAEADALADLLLSRATPALFSLVHDGRVTLVPAEADDARIVAAAQARALASGLAGHEAPTRFAARVRSAGAEVVDASTPWRLTAAESALVEHHLVALTAAAAQHDPNLGGPAQAWLTGRLEEMRAEHLALEVGHVDLLVLPGDHPQLAGTWFEAPA